MAAPTQRFARSGTVLKEPNPVTMSEGEYKEYLRRKREAEAESAAASVQEMEERLRQEKKQRRAAALAEKSERMLKQRMEAAQAHEKQLDLEAAERKNREIEEARRKVVQARHAKEAADRKAAIEKGLKESEEAAKLKAAAEKDAKLDARRNRSITSAMGATEHANKVANTAAEIRLWELEIESKRAVVYVRSDGSKFATDSAKFAANPATAEKFFLKGTRLDKLKGQMEPIDVSTRVLMDAAILRQQIAVVCTKSIQLEARTAAFLNSETDTTLPPT